MKQHNLGAPSAICQAPDLAYGVREPFHMGDSDMPRSDADYREYKFLARFPVAEHADVYSARAAARAKFGPKANAFYTARYWVAYVIR